MRAVRWMLLWSAAVAACGAPTDDGDGRDDPFLIGGKADGFDWSDGSPVAYAVLTVANTYSQQALIDDAHLASSAASEILKWRDGSAINTLWELDNVPFVGRNTLKALVRHVQERELVVRPTNQAHRRLRHPGLVIAEYVAEPANQETGEFVEIYNAGPIAIDLAGLSISDGDAEDVIEARNGGSTLLASGATAIVLDPDHAGDYALPAEALQVTIGDGALGNGLTGGDPLFAYWPPQWTLVDGAGSWHSPTPGAVRRPLVGPGNAGTWISGDCTGSHPLGLTPGGIDCNLATAAPAGTVGIGGACPLGSIQCESGICLVDSGVGGATCAADCSASGCPAGSTCITLDDDGGTGISRVCVADAAFACPVDEQASGSFLIHTTGGPNRFASSCGGAAAPDEAVRFTAPIGGRYSFRLSAAVDGSASSPCSVIAALADDCDRELACESYSTFEPAGPAIEVDLRPGESIRIVADSACVDQPLSGSVVVEREAGAFCPDADLGGQTGSAVIVAGTDGPSEMAGSCGGDNAPEHTYAWTAPRAGLYTFDTAGSLMDTVLYALDGGCGGTELACNDNAIGQASRVSLFLDAGQRVVIGVDGAFGSAGEFTLSIREEVTGGECPDADIGSAVGVSVATGSTVDATNQRAGSCGGGLGAERVYVWRAPADGQYTFDTFGSALGTVLYARDGGCDGAELACNDEAGGGHQSQITLQLAAGQQIAIVVDGWSSFGGWFTLNIAAPDDPVDPGEDPYATLSDAALRAALRADVVGHTVLNYNFARSVMFTTLHNDGGSVRCVYTGVSVQTTGIPDPDVMNTEHTWPKSWGPDTFETVSDLNHLFPTMNAANSIRASHPFGEVTVATWESGGSQRGFDAGGFTVFEPRDDHKGNVARAMFYFTVRYDTWLDPVQEQVLKQWNRDDPPDGAERARNAQVEAFQGKRNPFIDFPERAERISDF